MIPRTRRSFWRCSNRGRVQIYVDPLIAGHHDLQEPLQDLTIRSRVARTKVQHAIINHHLPPISRNAQILGGKSQ